MSDFRENISYSTVGGRTVASLVLTLESIPSYELFYENDAEAVAYIKRSFTVILQEFADENYMDNVSLEMIWSCKPATNQSFRSYIDVKLVFRAVGASQYECLNSLSKTCPNIINNLHSLKFVTRFDSFSEYTDILAKINSNPLFTVRRSEELTYFELAAYSCAYKYDPVPEFDIDMDLIVNALITETNSAVIFQIIPTKFSDYERMYIANSANILGRIVQGMPMPGMGFYRDQRAGGPLRAYNKYQEHSTAPMLFLNMMVATPTSSDIGVASRVASLMRDNKTDYLINFDIVPVPSPQIFYYQPYSSPWMLSDDVLKCNRNAQFLSSQLGTMVKRLSSLYAPTEVAQVFRFPIGTRTVTAGIPIHDIEKRHKKFADGIIDKVDLSIGKLQNVIGGERSYIGVNLGSLTRHMLVVGMPGSGKSTFLVGLMDRLWKQHGIPFLVIEPAKNEYRALIDSIPELQIFSPGNNKIAPLVLNPFAPPKGVSIEKYKSIVKSAFSAAFEMWTPLDQLFDETLNICYSEQGWLDSTVIDDSSDCFSLADFIRTYKNVVASKGYGGEYKKQIETAGVLRFNGLIEQNANIFDSRYSVPIEDILSKPTVIELSSIKDIKQKSFIAALLLNNIYAYLEANNVNDGRLKNVILLEEAHAILSAGGQSSGDGGADANAAAVKLLTDMLAEIRSRGVGIVVADQSPKKVTYDVVANTNIKVMFRLTGADDKDIVRRSTPMSDVQAKRLGKLTTGQAMLFFDRLDEVEEIVTDNYRINNGISTDLSIEELGKKMTYWQSRTQLLKPYIDCDHIHRCAGGCDVDTRSSAKIIADRIFRSYFSHFKDRATFAEFYKKVSAVIRHETLAVFKDEAMFDKISHCVKVQLLRKVHYGTDTNVDMKTRRSIYERMPENQK